jgi:hypothetical protein
MSSVSKAFIGANSRRMMGGKISGIEKIGSKIISDARKLRGQPSDMVMNAAKQRFALQMKSAGLRGMVHQSEYNNIANAISNEAVRVSR